MRWLPVAFVLVAACYDLPLDDPRVTNAPPLARAGTGGTVPPGTQITLDSAGSVDPEGAMDFVQWRVERKPDSSTVALPGTASPTHAVTLDAAGTYVFTLAVRDAAGAADEDSVMFTVVAPTLTADAGADRDVAWRTPVQLAGAFTAEEPAGATYAWTVVSGPIDATPTLAASDTATPTFTADRVGDYVLRLTVTTPTAQGMDLITLRSAAAAHSLPYQVQQAAYTDALARFVFLASEGFGSDVRLHRHDPVTGTEVSIAVGPPIGYDLDLDPAGTRALVASTEQLVVVDLATMTVEHTIPLPGAPVRSCTLGGDGRAHCIDAGDALAFPVRTIDLATGAVADSDTVIANALGLQVNPATSALYVFADAVTRFDAAPTPVALAWTITASTAGFYHLWFADDGMLAVATDGSVLAPADTQPLDLSRRGAVLPRMDFRLSGVDISAGGLIAGVSQDAELGLFDAATASLREYVPLPMARQGAFAVAIDASETTAYVVASESFLSTHQVIAVPL